MICVDTSVWIDHFRRSNNELIELLNAGDVCVHPFIIGEISCGHLKYREEILDALKQLPQLHPATHEDCLKLIEENKLYGKGIGFVDVHLLAACKLSNAVLMTYDKTLSKLSHLVK